MDYGLIGPMLSLSISAVGSCIGCWIAGAASHAVMSRVEEGHAKFIAMSAAPSSQLIYGFILMLLMAGKIKAGALSPEAGVVIGFLAGCAFFASSVFQGRVCATGMQATAKQPALFGKCFVAIGVIESFALFAFVFTLLLIG